MDSTYDCAACGGQGTMERTESDYAEKRWGPGHDFQAVKCTVCGATAGEEAILAILAEQAKSEE